jgi:16S rRNA (guanine527-N7)-methyltransferase
MFHVKQAEKHFHDYGINVSRETAEKLVAYAQLLDKWQRTINLVSKKTLPEMLERHFLDSAQLSLFVPESARTLYDLGSGAGFPGMVLAMLRPEIYVHLIESDQRKCAFLGAVSRETGTPVIINNARLDSLYNDLPAPDIVTARAFAPLVSLFEGALPWARENANMHMLLLKGASVDEEIEVARQSYSFNYKKHNSKTDASGSVLCVRALDNNCE